MVGQQKGVREWAVNGTGYWKVAKLNATAFGRHLRRMLKTVSRFN